MLQVALTMAMIAAAAASNAAWALPIPPHIKAFLLSRGRTDLVTRFESIPEVSPEEFAAQFASRQQRPLGAGFNGLVFLDDQNKVTKFSNAVMAAVGKVTLSQRPGILRFTPEQVAALAPQWSGLLANTGLRDANVPALRGVAQDEPLGSQPLGEELLGTLIWSSFNPRYTAFPEVVSSDGLAFRTRLIEGVPLAKILRSQREGTDLHRNYDMAKLWRVVVFWQQMGRLMLRDLGLTLDMFQPSNMMVYGTADQPQIELLDHALARPTAEALSFYTEHNWVIPPPPIPETEMRLIVWPTMSQHVVSSLLWSMSFQQAVDYMKAYYDLEDGYDAIRRIAALEPWTIVEAPFLGDYTNIRIARRILRRHGSRAPAVIRRTETRGVELQTLAGYVRRPAKTAPRRRCENALDPRNH
jgi:hypothetical protein